MTARSLLARAVAVLLIAAVAVAVTRRPGPEVQIVEAEFERAGLNVRPGDEVRVRGLPVGTIRSIEVDRGDFSARYVLAVDDGVRIAADTHARLVPKTLFGDKYVELDGARPGGPVLRSGARIPRRRTEPATEIQQVVDRAVATLEAVDPVVFSATLASLAEGLDGAGADLRRFADGATAAFEELARRRQELARLLGHVPGVAEELTRRAPDLETAARTMSDVAHLLAEREPDLGRFLAENAELTARAGELLAAESARVNRIVPDVLDVLAIVADRPGQVAALARSAPIFTEGLAAVTATGAFRSPLAHFVVLGVPARLDGAGDHSEARGGTGIGPDVYVHGLDPPNHRVDIGPTSGPSGLGALLGSLVAGDAG